jgi:selenocysteine-specific elongation factor
VAAGELEAVRARALKHVRSRDGSSPGVDLAALASSLGLDTTRLRAALADDRALVVERDLVREATAAPVEASPEARALLDALSRSPFEPPAPADVGASPALVRALVGSGALVEVDGVVFSGDAFAAARERIVEAIRERGGLTVSAVRDVLGTTRKYVLPILQRLDADGVTRREGDERVLGPRA